MRDPFSTMRILWITTRASHDGPGRALSTLLSNWPAPADAIGVFALCGIEGAFRRAVPSAIETRALDIRGIGDVRALLRLRRWCRDWRPDIIHTQLSRADWIGRTIGRAIGVPVVTTIQNVHSRMYAAEYAPVVAGGGRALDRLTAPMASRIIAVSEGVRADLGRAGVSAGRLRVIPNGIDLTTGRASDPRDAVRRRWNVGPEEIVVASVALLKAQKGMTTLVDAAADVIRRNPRVSFVHMGDGPERDRIARAIGGHGLEQRFRLLGQVVDPVAELSGADMFVMPSLWEGLPLALLEALASGLPAIGTRVEGIEDVIEDGVSGVLVPPADPAALGRAILELAGDAGRRERLAVAARQRAAAFAGADRRCRVSTPLCRDTRPHCMSVVALFSAPDECGNALSVLSSQFASAPSPLRRSSARIPLNRPRAGARTIHRAAVRP